MTNHYAMDLNGHSGPHTDEQQFHLPRINSYSANPRAASRVSSLGEMVDRYTNDRYAKYESARQAHAKSNEYNSGSSSSFNMADNVKAVYAPDINRVSIPIFGTTKFKHLTKIYLFIFSIEIFKLIKNFKLWEALENIKCYLFSTINMRRLN